MNDNLRRYRAIRDALTQWYPGQPTGTVARHLTTLAALISGIVGSKSTQLPSVATKIPDGAKPEIGNIVFCYDKTTRFFVQNHPFLCKRYFVCKAGESDRHGHCLPRGGIGVPEHGRYVHGMYAQSQKPSMVGKGQTSSAGFMSINVDIVES